MELITSTIIQNAKGKNVDGNLTIAEALSEILEKTESANSHYSWKLSRKVLDDPVELKAEDIVLIKEVLTRQRIYFPVVSGYLEDLFKDQ